MTDKAEMPAEISVWLDRWGDHRLCAESFDDTTRYIRADLHDAQAAEIERLRIDAARYQWLRRRLEVCELEDITGGRRPGLRTRIGYSFFDSEPLAMYSKREPGVDIDAAIDAALRGDTP